MPKAHQRHLEWTPSRIIGWAQTIGPQTAALVEAILADRPHPEQGYRSCLGILRLAERYGPARLEAACARAGSVAARSYRHVDSILKHGLDQPRFLRRRRVWRCRRPRTRPWPEWGQALGNENWGGGHDAEWTAGDDAGGFTPGSGGFSMIATPTFEKSGHPPRQIVFMGGATPSLPSCSSSSSRSRPLPIAPASTRSSSGPTSPSCSPTPGTSRSSPSVDLNFVMGISSVPLNLVVGKVVDNGGGPLPRRHGLSRMDVLAHHRLQARFEPRLSLPLAADQALS